MREVIEERMEGKRGGKGKPLIMMLDDIKADETHKKIKRRAMNREFWRNWMPRTCFQAEHQSEVNRIRYYEKKGPSLGSMYKSYENLDRKTYPDTT